MKLNVPTVYVSKVMFATQESQIPETGRQPDGGLEQAWMIVPLDQLIGRLCLVSLLMRQEI